MPLDPSRLHAVAGHVDLIDECAKAVVAHFSDSLPDLRRAVIIAPHQLYQARWRRHLIAHAQERGYAALLTPTITTPGGLFRQRILPHPETPSRYECELLIANALAEHPHLLPHTSRWEFARQFLELFDKLAKMHPQTLPKDLNTSTTAEVVEQLYEVWYTIQEKTPDTRALYRNSLRKNTLIGDTEHVFICGSNELSPDESAWASRLYATKRLTLITRARASGRYVSPALEIAEPIIGEPLAPVPTDTAFGHLLDATFSAGDDIAARARAIKSRFADSPAQQRISVFKPETLERHAFGIYLQICDWLEARISPIAVISQDRKLSRRLRAVLEGDNIPLHDHAGWALSTTTSAAALATLATTSERGFSADTILALARSPFCHYGIDIERAQAAGACLEKKLGEFESFKSFDETVDALTRTDLQHGRSSATAKDARLIVKRIDSALAGLRQLARRRRAPLKKMFDALFKSMQALGMDEALQRDDAGKTLIGELEAMAVAASRQDVHGNWNQWHGWITHTLERKKFVPKEHRYLLELYSLSQATLARPAGLIIAALDTDHTMPGDPLPLIDEELRRTFGMRDRNWQTAVQFDLFRTALENADRILLTCQKADNGRILTPAPWVEGLQHFHTLAYGTDLEEQQLEHRAEAAIRSTTGTTMPPATQPEMPAPKMPAWTERLSVGTVQAAVACPYRFFAKRVLKLAPAPEAERYDSLRNYSLRMHRCMAALHAKAEHLPGPMDKPWDQRCLDYALRLARDIVETEFAPYAKRHYSAVAGRQQALESIGWYVRWLIEKIDADATFEAEVPSGTTLADGLHLHGRPDCVIHEEDGIHILDYKNRYARPKSDILTGEDIQLTAYALFYEQVKAVSYMDMKKCTAVTIAGEELDDAQKRLRKTLQTFKADAAKLPLPAWASDKSCQYCDYSGVCRRKAWA